MRAALEGFARRWWAGELGVAGRALSVLAAPLSWVWGWAASHAVRRQAAAAVRVDGLAVVSVGNLAVGGTGKTPLTAWIAAALQEAGVVPAVLVGGHGRDEARLLERRLPGVPVFVDRDRCGSAVRAAAGGARVAVLDDGFQHRRLARELDVVLLAAEDLFPGQVLPGGPYREPAEALARADVVVITRRVASEAESRALAARIEARLPGRVAGGVSLAAGGWTDLEGAPVPMPEGDVLAVCAIARPGAFRSAVEGASRGKVELVAFEDHHDYTAADAARLRARAAGRPLVVTEKDAVKLRAHAGTLGKVCVFTEHVAWDWGEEAFRARLRSVIPSGVRA